MTSWPLENCVVIFRLKLLVTDVIKEQMSLVEDRILVDLMIYLNGFKIGILKNIFFFFFVPMFYNFIIVIYSKSKSKKIKIQITNDKKIKLPRRYSKHIVLN